MLPMALVEWRIENRVALVHLDQGAMNTLSRAAMGALEAAAGELEAVRDREALIGAILVGNARGLGAGADIHELMAADRSGLAELIDAGHRLLFRIEASPVPWVALVDGVCLGGIYELALACRGIVATARSRLGFPEINLNIFPGLGGTQRLPRRMARGPAGPEATARALQLILHGRVVSASEAAAEGMVDAVVPDGTDPVVFAKRLLAQGLQPPPQWARAPEVGARALAAAERTARERARGRDRPRAPFVVIEVVRAGARVPLREAIALERDSFIEVASSAEAKAGMRFFFAQQRAQKGPSELAGVRPAREVRRVGIHAVETPRGLALAALARRARLEVVGHVADARSLDAARRVLGACPDATTGGGREAPGHGVSLAVRLDAVGGCDVVIDAGPEALQPNAELYRALARLVDQRCVVCPTSSLLAPAALAAEFAAGGGDPSNLVGLHFVPPVRECRLVEVVHTESTSMEALAAALGLARLLGKTAVLLKDWRRGLLVTPAVAACLREAEALYREGTPPAAIDAAVEAAALALGPFALADSMGLETVAALIRNGAPEAATEEPLARKLASRGRRGAEGGGGFYDYADGKRTRIYPDLDALAGSRGERSAGPAEIVERCLRALWRAASEALDAGMVASAEEADLAFVLGAGFAMHLGGPFFHAAQQGWR